jgi:hypothetical protein
MFSHRYNENKKNYLAMCRQLITNPLSGGEERKINLEKMDANCIREIGEIEIRKRPVVAISQWEEIDLVPGTYMAYAVVDDIMLVNKGLNIKPDESVVSWDWKFSGKSVSGDGISFGFYDLDALEKITTDEEKKSRHVPEFDIMYSDDMMPGDIIDGINLFAKRPDMENYGPFAAVKLLMINQPYDCYQVDDNRAILIGRDNNKISDK